MSEDKRTEETPATEQMDGAGATAEDQAQSVETKAAETVAGTGAEAEPTEETGEAELSDAEVIAQLREELAAAEAKAADYLDKMQRTAADFQNSRRRLENQLAEEIERANAALIMRLLPVLDDFDLAFQNAGDSHTTPNAEEQESWLEGFRRIHKKLLDTLSEYGVERINSDGEFDPMEHDALSSEPNESVPSGHIIDTMRAGYKFKGRVLRPALVRVAQ